MRTKENRYYIILNIVILLNILLICGLIINRMYGTTVLGSAILFYLISLKKRIVKK